MQSAHHCCWFWRCSLWLVVAAVGVLGPAWQARAAEPAQKFLEALRNEGYYEYANDYLERMQTSPLAPKGFKETVPYEQGATLIAASREARTTKLRQESLDAAQAKFREFLKAHPDHPLAMRANEQLGRVVLERARLNMAVAERTNDEDKKKALITEAQKHYQAAHKVLLATKADMMAFLKKHLPPPDPKKQPELHERVIQTQGAYIDVQMEAADVLLELAKTEKPGSKERTARLEKAAAAFKEVGTKYRRYLAGLFAQIKEGQCYKEMGKLDDALAVLELLLELDKPEDNPNDTPREIRMIKAMAMEPALEIWLEKKNYKDPILVAAPWVKRALPDEAQTVEFIRLKFLVGKAYKLDADGRPSTDPFKRKHELEAKALLTEVKKYESPVRDEAIKLLASMGVETKAPAKEEPTDFASAAKRANEEMRAGGDAKNQLRALQEELAKAKDDAAKEKIQKKIEKAQAQMAKAYAAAQKYFNVALSMVTKETPADDLNHVRYGLAYLHYMDGEYYQAASIADFIARRHQGFEKAPQAALLAMYSFRKLYDEQRAAESKEYQFEMRRIVDSGNLIIDSWPGTAIHANAVKQVVPFELALGELDSAAKHLQKLPETEKGRYRHMLRLGQARWVEAFNLLLKHRELKAKAGDDQQLAAQAAEAKRAFEDKVTKAERWLKEGIKSARDSGDKPDYLRTSAMLNYAHALIETGRHSEALTVLTAPDDGPKTLVDKGEKFTDVEGFPESVYRYSLLAYAGALAESSQPDALLKEAIATLDKLKTRLLAKPEGSQAFINYMKQIVLSVSQQINDAPAEKRAALISGFRVLLSQLIDNSKNYDDILWAANTLESLSPADAKKGAPPKDVVELYDKAYETYKRVMTLSDNGQLQKITQTTGQDGKVVEKTETLILDKEAILPLRLRMARNRKQVGDYKTAVEQYGAILKEQNFFLVQIEAAQTLEDWGDREQSVDLYGKAILGAEPDDNRRNAIWGWGELAKRCSSYMRQPNGESYKPYYFQTRLRLAECRYKQGLYAATTEDQTNYLNRARLAIKFTEQVDSDFGGMKNDYVTLLNKVENRLKSLKEN